MACFTLIGSSGSNLIQIKFKYSDNFKYHFPMSDTVGLTDTKLVKTQQLSLVWAFNL